MKTIKRSGNTNRILEAHAGGLGECQIAGMFQDEGINITAVHVKSVIEMEDAGFSKKSLPKKVVKDAVAFKQGKKSNQGASIKA